MLTINIPPKDDAYDEETNTFFKVKGYTLKLEHSLLSLYKWEAKHNKYLLDNQDNLTYDEIIDYIRCMTLNQVDDVAYDYLTGENIKEIREYMEAPMTATWFNNSIPNSNQMSGHKEIVTAEVIYSSMIILGIPIDIFEKRHLNHLLTLIRVCNEKQNPDTNSNKKMSEYQMLKHYQELNRSRKAKKGV